MSTASEIQAILDEGKDSIPDGLYLQLSNKLLELHNSQRQDEQQEQREQREEQLRLGRLRQRRRQRQEQIEERLRRQRLGRQIRFVVNPDLATPATPGLAIPISAAPVQAIERAAERYNEQRREELARQRREEQAARINSLRGDLPPISPEELANPNPTKDIRDTLVPVNTE